MTDNKSETNELKTPFLGRLTRSDVFPSPEGGRKPWRFQDLEGRPEKVVRARDFTYNPYDSASTENEVRLQATFLDGWERARKLGVPLPNTQIAIGPSDQQGRMRVYTIVDKIHGHELGNLPKSNIPFPGEELDDVLSSMFEYAKGVYENGGCFWRDFVKPGEMFMYGRRKGENKDRLWLVDLEFGTTVKPHDLAIVSAVADCIREFDINEHQNAYPKTRVKIIELLTQILKEYPYHLRTQEIIKNLKEPEQ